MGYLGEGILDICVAGQIFASPSASRILTGLKALDAPHGYARLLQIKICANFRRILMIVKNYTGDKLNFGIAAQKAKAEGIQVNFVFVGDDVSVKNSGLVGRRGLAGVICVHKIAGALSATGYVCCGKMEHRILIEFVQCYLRGSHRNSTKSCRRYLNCGSELGQMQHPSKRAAAKSTIRESRIWNG